MSWELTIAAMLAISACAATFVAWPLLTGRTKPEEFFGDEAAARTETDLDAEKEIQSYRKRSH